ncbi:hypothetical protein E3N88_11876 [Mikania micrantha]|uniref:Uncharacterized protein n=1 Tax=Mikania micrantha TaxID=192012 RepID=A0A5N6P597_9ASTR|nr:hypothetical protein E3N88_11876 [Mikania micrantha]
MSINHQIILRQNLLKKDKFKIHETNNALERRPVAIDFLYQHICPSKATPINRFAVFTASKLDKRPCSEENQALNGISAFSEQIPRCALSCQILHWQCRPMHDRAQLCTTVQIGSASPCMAVLAYARQCLNHARPCKLASAGPNGGSAGHDDLRTTMRLLARPCLTPRVNFRDLAENGNFDNRPRPKVKYCSTLHDHAPMVHDRAKFQNFYKFSFSPHFKGLDFLEPKYLLFRFLEAV